MYKYRIAKTTYLQVNETTEGETIEQKIHRIVNNKEPITDGAPLIYTERKDGVKPEYDIRTDRWEIAADAMDVVAKATRAKREDNKKTIGEEAKEGMSKESNDKKSDIGGPESVAGTTPPGDVK